MPFVKFGEHWRYCSKCDRWWFTASFHCERCLVVIKSPDKRDRRANDALIAFMQEFCEFESGLADFVGRDRYDFTMNEVAGLMWVCKRERARACHDL